MGLGSEFRGLNQSVVEKEMRMRVERSFRSFGCEGEGCGEEGKRDMEFRHPEGTAFCHQIDQNGKELIRWSLGPSPSNLLKYLAAFVCKKEFTDIHVSIYSQNKIITPNPPPNPRVPITVLLPILF